MKSLNQIRRNRSLKGSKKTKTWIFATLQFMQIFNKSTLEPNRPLLLNSNPLRLRTNLSLFSLLKRSQNLSSSRKNLRVRSPGTICLVLRKRNPLRLLKKYQNNNLEIKRSMRMKWPSKNLSLKKRISFQWLSCCVSVHFLRMKS